jgi:hypothetical protein
MNDSAADDSPSVAIPVKCPKCAQVFMCDFPILVVVTALMRWKNMNLYLAGHVGAWDATEEDLRLIREHVGEAWLEAQQNQLRWRP